MYEPKSTAWSTAQQRRKLTLEQVLKQGSNIPIYEQYEGQMSVDQHLQAVFLQNTVQLVRTFIKSKLYSPWFNDQLCQIVINSKTNKQMIHCLMNLIFPAVSQPKENIKQHQQHKQIFLRYIQLLEQMKNVENQEDIMGDLAYTTRSHDNLRQL